MLGSDNPRIVTVCRMGHVTDRIHQVAIDGPEVLAGFKPLAFGFLIPGEDFIPLGFLWGYPVCCLSPGTGAGLDGAGRVFALGDVGAEVKHRQAPHE